MISAPTICSSFSKVSLISSTWSANFSSVQPPPMTMPSSTAAFVAFKASSTRSFFSFNSVSVWAPTWMMATPPERRAILSFSFSFSYSVVASFNKPSICLTRALTSSWVRPSPTTVVESLVTSTRAAMPNTSAPTEARFIPSSGLTTVPPVRMAISSRYCVFRSPKPGALMAQTFKEPRSRFTTSVARASCSISSAMMISGKPSWMDNSRTPTMSRAEEIFLSTNSSLAPS
mmetsp:Transcript_61924/g.102834  ORF Transcript_61924/g.102834 Transcript_61924/m.102834 type:complete len:231 (-) Transcript_61924:1230-1922(-)